MKAVFAILIAGGLLGLNVWLLLANRKTPVPEGCENLAPDCKACGIGDCSLRREFTEQGKGAVTNHD